MYLHAIIVCLETVNPHRHPPAGVSLDKRIKEGGKTYYARISMGHRTQKALGYFHTPEEAARAYDREARRMGKPLNFPNEVREQFNFGVSTKSRNYLEVAGGTALLEFMNGGSDGINASIDALRSDNGGSSGSQSALIV